MVNPLFMVSGSSAVPCLPCMVISVHVVFPALTLTHAHCDKGWGWEMFEPKK